MAVGEASIPAAFFQLRHLSHGEHASGVVLAKTAKKDECWCKLGPKGTQHHSTLLLRRGKKPKDPFEGLLLPLLLLALLLLQLSLLLILLQGSK
jgi:hypothetical protein